MPHLSVTYKGRTVFDGEVNSMELKEDDNSITLKARTGQGRPGGGLGGLVEALSKASQQRQQSTPQPAPEPIEPDEIQVPPPKPPRKRPAKKAAQVIVDQDVNGQVVTPGG